MTHEESARKIIDQGGSCHGVECEECFASAEDIRCFGTTLLVATRYLSNRAIESAADLLTALETKDAGLIDRAAEVLRERIEECKR